MPKQKQKQTREERLAQARLHKRKKYEEIKNDPEKYAIQKEKERLRYLKRKEQKKIKTIATMTPREKRLQRKKWKENSRRHLEKKKKLKEIQQMMMENSPPESEIEDNLGVEQDPLEGPSRLLDEQRLENCSNCIKNKKLIRRLRYRFDKQIGVLKQEKEKLQKDKKSLMSFLNKVVKENKQLKEQSTEKKVDDPIENIDGEKREKVKKELLFGEIMKKNLKEGFKLLKKKEKRPFSDVIVKNKEHFKTHKILGLAAGFALRDKKLITAKEQKHEEKLDINQKIEEFYEDDSNSRISPGKKEFITRHGIRKQKRYLSDTLTNLHKKFLHTHNADVGYSTFCRSRPFWVLYPTDYNRNTCACKTHLNMDLLIKSLNRRKIIREHNGNDLLKYLCCDESNEKCLSRQCDECKNRLIEYGEFDNTEKINYHQWCAKKESYVSKGEEKTKTVTTKVLLNDYPRELVKILERILPKFFKHCCNIVAQYRNIKILKGTLTPNEAVVHLDFSENYSVKFHDEPQSYHFGGSRPQLTLHTSVVYLIDPETGILKNYSVCSISKCNRHDAAAVWAHLIPLIEYIKILSPDIDTIHFVSDSPSSQYRNRFMFFVISQLEKDFPDLNYITWNYLEAGHGKGAPDGVGAVLKRSADEIIRFNNDIGTIEQFWEHVQKKVKNVKMLSVSEEDVNNKKFPSQVQAFRGTLAVHQVLWSSDQLRMTFRRLSCFLCQNCELCHHGYHLGYIDVPNINYGYTDELEISSNMLDGIDDVTFPDCNIEQKQIVQHHDEVPPSTISKGRKITVLSEVRILPWQNTTFIDKTLKTPNMSYQNDFENFVSVLNQRTEQNDIGSSNTKKQELDKNSIEKENQHAPKVTDGDKDNNKYKKKKFKFWDDSDSSVEDL